MFTQLTENERIAVTFLSQWANLCLRELREIAGNSWSIRVIDFRHCAVRRGRHRRRDAVPAAQLAIRRGRTILAWYGGAGYDLSGGCIQSASMPPRAVMPVDEPASWAAQPMCRQRQEWGTFRYVRSLATSDGRTPRSYHFHIAGLLMDVTTIELRMAWLAHWVNASAS